MGGDSSGSSSAYDAAVNSDGDVLVTGYSQANSWYFDDGFTVEYPIENRERNAFLFLIDTDAKVMPSCLESTTTCAIKAEKCYINGVCYDSGDTAANVGTDCMSATRPSRRRPLSTDPPSASRSATSMACARTPRTNSRTRRATRRRPTRRASTATRPSRQPPGP